MMGHVKKTLGKLELKVMEQLWEKGSMTVRELWEKDALQERAYTTIMTTMERLWQKGLLNRVKEGNAYRYAPVQQRDQYWRDLAHGTIQELMNVGGASNMFSAFIDAAVVEDEANLERLENMIQEYRKNGEHS